MTQVALPPGVYTIQVPGVGQGARPVALTNPAENGQPLTLQPFDPNNPDQQVREQSTTLYDIPHSPVISWQFIINASGLIIASFNRNSLAYSQIPSLSREPVKRSTTGVSWLINVKE
jgi:hypothetical protein